MEDMLKRLLDAELHAETLVQEANSECEHIIKDALEQTRAAETEFEARIPALRAAFTEQAGQRAQQAIAELKQHYDERLKQLRDLAEAHEQEAIAAAIALVIDPASC